MQLAQKYNESLIAFGIQTILQMRPKDNPLRPHVHVLGPFSKRKSSSTRRGAIEDVTLTIAIC
jgi:hypothetical protein